MLTCTSPSVWDWKFRLRAILPLFGHRNWIVVADSAYPAQSNPGIETIVAGCDQFTVIEYVLAAIEECKHIRPNVYADKELAFVPEIDAPGVEEFRRKLSETLQEATVNYLPHEQIIGKLDRSAQLFRVLIIKSDISVPYTTIFLELDCRYFSPEAEKRLREAIAASDSK